LPVPAIMKSETANLAEVFSSIQGEGVHIGRRQIFIRFVGCNLACEYCDTHLLDGADSCRLEATPGRGDFIDVANPVPMDRVVELVGRWSAGWPESGINTREALRREDRRETTRLCPSGDQRGEP